MKYGRFLVSCIASSCTLTTNVRAQEPSLPEKNEIVWAREFLRILYPGLNGKNYGLTVETFLTYDEPGSRISLLRMDVGEGPKDWIKGYFGGCSYSITPPPVGWPQELLGPPPPPVISPLSQDEWCKQSKQGPIYPKQFLSAGFQFDKEGHVTGFSADGPFIDDRKDDKEVYEIVRAHPQMTYAEIVSTMKQHGTKYGPDDKEQFIKDLPLKQLEPFLGKLRIVSVTFRQMDKDSGSVPWVDRWLWPDWTVKVQATTKDGANVPYELHFSHLNGYLTGLLDCRSSPSCSRD